jgi:hypothetical protein
MSVISHLAYRVKVTAVINLFRSFLDRIDLFQIANFHQFSSTGEKLVLAAISKRVPAPSRQATAGFDGNATRLLVHFDRRIQTKIGRLQNGGWNSHRSAVTPFLDHSPHIASSLCIDIASTLCRGIRPPAAADHHQTLVIAPPSNCAGCEKFRLSTPKYG